MTADEARQVLENAELICTETEVNTAVRRIAETVSLALRDSNPLVLAVMGGATVFAGHLLPQLCFPLEYDFLHATRYGDAMRGAELNWPVRNGLPSCVRVPSNGACAGECDLGVISTSSSSSMNSTADSRVSLIGVVRRTASSVPEADVGELACP
jgi:hypothetical protein